MAFPKSVVIIGGSMAGLMHGLQLKRHGTDVTILEQDPGSERSSHQAGVSFQENLREVISKYDLTGVPVAVPSAGTQFARHKRQDLYFARGPRELSNWSLLYRVFRANFDGLASVTVPNPPAALKLDGKARYLEGKKVTSLLYNKEKGSVKIDYTDVRTGAQETLESALVLAADGRLSTARKLVGAEEKTEYAGYVAWRGVVKESEMSETSKSYFENQITISAIQGSYMVTYIIPTDDGKVNAGDRLVNLVWYCKCAEDSDKLKEILTDIHGDTHKGTVPEGLLRPEVWESQKAAFLDQMTAPVAELASKIKVPFVTKIADLISTRANYYDGHLLLVGDSFSGYRPHLGNATEAAAFHVNAILPVWHGEKTLAEWEKEIVAQAGYMGRLSRVFGTFMMGQTLTCIGYAFALLKDKLWG